METDFEIMKRIFEEADFPMDVSPDDSDIIIFGDGVFYFSATGELQDYDSGAKEKGYI
jgi:hypothetical protein